MAFQKFHSQLKRRNKKKFEEKKKEERKKEGKKNFLIKFIFSTVVNKIGLNHQARPRN